MCRVFVPLLDDLSPGNASILTIVDGLLRPNASAASWYDELLVYDDTVLVVGYSYAAYGSNGRRGATELGLFKFDVNAGTLTFRRSYYLRSNDYYSSRNYANRLIGSNF